MATTAPIFHYENIVEAFRSYANNTLITLYLLHGPSLIIWHDIQSNEGFWAVLAMATDLFQQILINFQEMNHLLNHFDKSSFEAIAFSKANRKILIFNEKLLK